MLRTRLYQIQAAIAIRLKQVSLTQVGRARADRTQRLSASPVLGFACRLAFVSYLPHSPFCYILYLYCTIEVSRLTSY